MSLSEDEKIYNIAVAKIRRSSMDVHEWKATKIGVLHEEVDAIFKLDPGELPLVSGYFSRTSWYVITTRRIVASCGGRDYLGNPQRIASHDFGNFKGIKGNSQMGAVPCGTVKIQFDEGPDLLLEFETGKPSMAPIYAIQYWTRKHRFLSILSGRPPGQ